MRGFGLAAVLELRKHGAGPFPRGFRPWAARSGFDQFVDEAGERARFTPEVLRERMRRVMSSRSMEPRVVRYEIPARDLRKWTDALLRDMHLAQKSAY